MIPLNVIVFGESGAGKSSLINMFSGKDIATTSSSAQGCTFGNTAYPANILGEHVLLYDTAGLNEITTVDPSQALANLYKLVSSLQAGVSLLVYVFRAPRIKESTVQNYTLFYDIFCQKNVPILLVITGLECETSMDGWWVKNEHIFSKHEMFFASQTCITATKGKQLEDGRFVYQEEYEASREKVRRSLCRNVLATPWRMEPTQWFILITKKWWNAFARLFGMPLLTYSQLLYDAFVFIGGHSKEHAKALANGVFADLQRGMLPHNVLVFGESGVGKSSIVNMVAEKDIATTSSDDIARGCTFASTPYPIDIPEGRFLFHDTTGLNEITAVQSKDALMNLYRLVLSLREGVNLLVYVTRGPRVREFVLMNYRLFHDIFCQKQVPILFVVTGLENEDSMEGWWDRNSHVFVNYGMRFTSQACVTAITGKQLKSGTFVYQQEYEESRVKLKERIGQNTLTKAWRKEPVHWFTMIARDVWRSFGRMLDWSLLDYKKSIYEALVHVGGFPEREAKDQTKFIMKGLDG